MDDLINRKAAIEAFDRIQLSRIKGLGLELLISVSDAKGVLEGMKAVDAAPVKHGKWLPVLNGKDDDSNPAFDCSECDAMCRKQYNYCPRCGAKMDLEG